jgi:hypothetical protein
MLAVARSAVLLLIASEVCGGQPTVLKTDGHSFDWCGEPWAAEVSAGAWWAIVPDGLVITLLIMGCFLLGQAIEDALNP